MNILKHFLLGLSISIFIVVSSCTKYKRSSKNQFYNILENRLTINNESLLTKLEERFNYQIAIHGIKDDNCKYENYIKLLRANGGLDPKLEKEDIELLKNLKKVGLNKSRKENLNFLYRLTNEFSDKFEKETIEHYISTTNLEKDDLSWSILLEGLEKKYTCNDFSNNPTLKNFILVFIFLNLEYNSF